MTPWERAKRIALFCEATVNVTELDKDTRIVGFRVPGPLVGLSEGLAAIAEMRRAVKAHDDLVKALTKAVDLYRTYGLLAEHPDCGPWVNGARDALAKAEAL